MFVFCAKNFVLTLLTTLIIVISFCVFSVDAMVMEEKSSMHNCASGQTGMMFCGINKQSHFLVRNSFLFTPLPRTLNLLLTAFLFIVVLFFNWNYRRGRSFLDYYFHFVIRKIVFIIDPIRRALSRGIIHPQIYEPAVCR